MSGGEKMDVWRGSGGQGSEGGTSAPTPHSVRGSELLRHHVTTSDCLMLLKKSPSEGAYLLIGRWFNMNE